MPTGGQVPAPIDTLGEFGVISYSFNKSPEMVQ